MRNESKRKINVGTLLSIHVYNVLKIKYEKSE